MNIKKAAPSDILSSSESGIQELLRYFIMRTNFVPGVRHVIGWRGLKDSSSDVDGWTAKIKDYSGVFGISYHEFESTGKWVQGKFAINYFPNPDEDLADLFSLQAGLYIQKDEYLSHVRDFLLHPELCHLFNIGIIVLCINQSRDALILGLETVSRQRVIAEDGISLIQDGQPVQIVEPGGYDQNFPSYSTSFSLFKVLAASVTFNLEEPPVFLQNATCPGKEVIYDKAGHHRETFSKEAQQKYLFLGYGNGEFKNIAAQSIKKNVCLTKNFIWEKGESLPGQFKDELWWKAHQISDYKTLDKKILDIDDRPQLIVLTGFLGSGKTSFLQHFIEYQVQYNRFVAIIQNEIGETGLDGKLLDHDYAVTEIDEGCVCCTLVGNLKKAIHQILSSFHPDYIVLETTGLANPFNLLDEISEIEDLVKFDSVTTIVDGLNIKTSLENYEVAKLQIKAADILLLNKKEFLNEIQINKINQKLRELNPNAPVIATTHGDINPALLYDIDQITEMEEKYNINLQKEKTSSIHKSHKHDGLSSCKLSFTKPLNREIFLKAIESLPPDIFRMKGVVNFENTKLPVLIQYVAGRYELSEFKNSKFSEQFLILIGQGIQKDSIISDLRKKFAGS
ncbi:MAG: GTP-binding protein [Candidatus Desulfaltia sp.]|nr:GTP-binding protein [Candidatus Desulfaltia sp.]